MLRERGDGGKASLPAPAMRYGAVPPTDTAPWRRSGTCLLATSAAEGGDDEGERGEGGKTSSLNTCKERADEKTLV